MKGARSATASTTADSRLAVKRKTKKDKAAKDPNKPKRPASAFLIFMETFRVEFKENNPGNNSVAATGKAGGEKWRQMSAADKALYVAEAEQRKKDYEKKMQAYEKKQSDEEGSDKSKSEVHNEDEDDV